MLKNRCLQLCNPPTKTWAFFMPEISHSVADFINLLYDTRFDTKNLMILSVLSNCLWESGHSALWTIPTSLDPWWTILYFNSTAWFTRFGGVLGFFLQFTIYSLVWYDCCPFFVAILFKVPDSSFLLPSNYNRAELALLSDWYDHTIQVLAYYIYTYTCSPDIKRRQLQQNNIHFTLPPYLPSPTKNECFHRNFWPMILATLMIHRQIPL